jgi:hypothetical protein
MKKSVISKLPREKQFYVTLIVKLVEELVCNQIITPAQKIQIHNYLLKELTPQPKRKK